MTVFNPRVRLVDAYRLAIRLGCSLRYDYHSGRIYLS